MTRMTVVVAMVVALLTLVAGCGGGRPTDTGAALGLIRETKEIVAGWAPYAPYASRDTATGEVRGFYIDLFERVASEAGLEVKWVETTWGTMISDLKVGKFQVMAAPVFRTIPRSLEVGFTRSIDYFGYSAIVRKDEPRFFKVSDFNRADVTLAVTQGEVGHEYAMRHLPKAKLNIHKAGNISLALVDVIHRKADAGICDAWTARQFAREHADRVKDLFADEPFNTVGGGWFVRREEPDLLRFLDTSIDWLEDSGAIAETAARYDLPSRLR